jgi:hypothetical protein
MHLPETQGKGYNCWKPGARGNQSGYDTSSPVYCISGIIVGLNSRLDRVALLPSVTKVITTFRRKITVNIKVIYRVVYRPIF